MENRRIIGIGETVLDIVFKDNRPLAAVPGGSTFNAMVSLGRTIGVEFPDIQVIMVSRIGNDKVADIVLSFMKGNHMDTSMMGIAEGRSTVSIALLDENNNASYEFFRDPSLPPFDAHEIDFKEDDIVVFGSYFAVSTQTSCPVRSLIKKAREAGATVYYDINFRKSHAAELDKLRPEIIANIGLSDIVRGSSDDLEAVFGSSDAVLAYDRHISPLCPNFICTRGAGAVETFSTGVRCSFPVIKAGNVVSTIGAGDNFNAGTIYALVQNGMRRSRLNPGITETDWKLLTAPALKFSAEVCGSLFNYVPEGFKA